VGVIWLNRKPPSLIADAKSIMADYENGDGSTVYAHLWPEEKQKNKLNPERVGRIIERIVRPVFVKAKPFETLIYADELTYQGISAHDYRSKSGYEYTMMTQTWLREGETKADLSSMIKSAWNIEFGVLRDVKWSRATARQFMLLGLARDKEFLKQNGFSTMVRPDADGRTYIQTLDEIETNLNNTPQN